eukprot:COSAG01_NODE_69597_length_261_cov_0.549383_1_plen_32_part_10
MVGPGDVVRPVRGMAREVRQVARGDRVDVFAV